jgi:hypothetical protein
MSYLISEGRRGAGLHGDGLAEFQGGADELFQLASEVSHFPIDLAVAALEGSEAIEFRVEFADIL